MIILPDRFLRALADPTRVRILALLSGDRELCVCELTEALEMVQPKVSRHLGVLRESGVLLDRREGLWIYYRLHPDLPAWAARAMDAIHDGCQGKRPYSEDRKRLAAMPPQGAVSCNV
jgi:ArsR family transcriptional regulator